MTDPFAVDFYGSHPRRYPAGNGSAATFGGMLLTAAASDALGQQQPVLLPATEATPFVLPLAY